MSIANFAAVSTRHLTLLYKLALGSIALLIILGVLFFQVMTLYQAGDAQLINIAGRQRMFSQKMSKDAFALLVSADVQKEAQYIQDLQSTFTLWQQVHHGLQFGDATLGLNSNNNNAAITLQYSTLKPHYLALAEGIQGILSIVEQPNWLYTPVHQASELAPWLQMVLLHEPDYLQGMNAIVSLYEVQVNDRLRYTSISGFIFLIIMSFALFLIGYIVFRPALRHLQAVLNAHDEVETALRRSEERYRMVISNAPVVLFAIEANGMVTLSEGLGLKAMGRKQGQIVGQSIFDVYRDFPAILATARRALAGESLTVNNQIGDLTFETHYAPFFDEREEHRCTGVIGVAIDITERVRAEASLRRQAWYDYVTGLPNRLQLEMHLEQALQAHTPEQGCLTVLLLDIARFKEVNDNFGHHEGDLLLKQIADRLRVLFAPTDTIARIGGGEFAVLLPTCNEVRAHDIAARVIQSFDEPFLITQQSLQFQVTIGLVVAPTHGNDAQILLRRGDMAITNARRTQTPIVSYKPEFEQESMMRLALMGALRQAINEGQLFLMYQPQANLSTGVIHGVEALVRWQHPVYGIVPPDRFIPLAEQMGLITPLTHWALETAIKQCKLWREAGQDLVVSVNLSMWDLRDVTLPERIGRLLETYDVPASSLRVELTESAIMNDASLAMDILQRISDQDVCISIDDFGTGYSSLAYLKSLPVDELKIDRSFISQMVNDTADAMIVETTIALAHGLGLRVVAEGIEDLKTWNALADLKCDSMQGYYLSRPLLAKDLEALLARMPHVLDARGPSLMVL